MFLWKWKRVKLLSPVWLFAIPRTVDYTFLHPWDLPGKTTGVDCHFLLQGILPTQGSKPGLPHWGQMLHPLSHQGSPLLRWITVQFSWVQSLSRVQLFATPWTTVCQAFLFITNSQSLLKLMSIESVMPSSHLLCRPLLLLPPTPPSIRVFSNESALCTRWPKYWFQLQHQSFQWTPRTDLL